MPKSNLNLRSNLHVRDISKNSTEDVSFNRNIRGLKRVRRLLRSFGIPDNVPANDREIVNMFQRGEISKAQLRTLEWDIPCWRCKSIPVGETFDGKVEFRCKIEGCK
jgi:hypothetical protein